jgi:uncharacterized membrane protein YoaK (UPF0700 family)
MGGDTMENGEYKWKANLEMEPGAAAGIFLETIKNTSINRLRAKVKFLKLMIFICSLAAFFWGAICASAITLIIKGLHLW